MSLLAAARPRPAARRTEETIRRQTTARSSPRRSRSSGARIAFRRRRLPAVQVRAPGREEGDGGPHGADPEGARRRRRGARPTPRPRPSRSARRRATSTPSGPASSPTPTRRPRQLLVEGRARLDAEVAELEARADADIATAGQQVGRRAATDIGRARRRGDRAARRRRSSTTPRQCSSYRGLHRQTSAASDGRAEPMTDRIDGYARALFEIAQAEGNLDEVEDELFRFARDLEGSDELRNALTDELVPVERRQAIVEDLLGAKASPTTTQLVSLRRRLRPRPRPAGHHRQARRAGRQREGPDGRRGPLGHRPHRRPAAPPRRRPRQRHRQAGRA